MGNARGQLANGFQFLGLQKLAFQLAQLSNFAAQQQYAYSLPGFVRNRIHGQINQSGPAVRMSKAQVVQGN